MKTIWIARSANDGADVMRCFFSREEALQTARMYFNHLTDREKKFNTVSVESHRVDVSDDDTRTAQELYDWLYDISENAWIEDPATYEVITDD